MRCTASIGIRLIVVFIPGHAPIFLETTMVGGYEFEQALKVANARIEQEIKANNFKTGASHMLDIGKIRSSGFGAMPPAAR